MKIINKHLVKYIIVISAVFIFALTSSLIHYVYAEDDILDNYNSNAAVNEVLLATAGDAASTELAADEELAVNDINFPDDNFRNYISKTYDVDEDGYINPLDVTIINVISEEIISLKGIEYFTNLRYLYCDNNQISSLDVSSNTLLESLYCNNNQISNLDVSNNTLLLNLYCTNNQISSLDVSSNTKLYDLHCENNQIESLDVSSNTALRYLNCSNNQISSLDISNNAYLKYFSCEGTLEQ